MKCQCGYENESPQVFWTHVAEGRKDGITAHGKIDPKIDPVEAPVQKAAAKPKPEPKAKPSKQPQPKQQSEPLRASSLFGNRWVMIGLEIFGFVLSLGLGNSWLKAKNPNMAIGLVVIILFIGCPVLIWRTWRNGGISRNKNAGTRVVRPSQVYTNAEAGAMLPLGQEAEAATKNRGVKNDAPALAGEINAFNIYVRNGRPDIGENKVVPVMSEFCHMEDDKLLGQPRQCLNDRKWYHVHVVGPEPNQIRGFALADAAFVDPGLMARYLDAPCQRSYIEFIRETMAKWVGPGLLALMDGVLLIMIYIRSSSG